MMSYFNLVLLHQKLSCCINIFKCVINHPDYHLANGQGFPESIRDTKTSEEKSQDKMEISRGH